MDTDYHAQDEEMMREAIRDGEVDTMDLIGSVNGLCDLAKTNRNGVRLQLTEMKDAADKLNELIIVLEG